MKYEKTQGPGRQGRKKDIIWEQYRGVAFVFFSGRHWLLQVIVRPLSIQKMNHYISLSQ